MPRDDTEYACPADQYYRAPGICPTGFHGCVAYSEAALACYNDWEPVTRKIDPRIDGTCGFDKDTGASYGDFMVCGSQSGKLVFSGCAKGVGCEFWRTAAPAPVPEPAPVPSPAPVTPAPAGWKCSSGATFYSSDSKCTSGFVGCTDEKAVVCDAGTVTYGNSFCPPGYNWLVCKGLSGCAKGSSVCD
jgi:hypothetical protein